MTPSVGLGIVLHTDDEPTDKPADDVVGRWCTNASCVVISPNYVLATRHQGGGVEDTIQIGGTDYTIAQVSNIGSVDLRVVRITTTDGQPANLPDWVPHYTDRDEKDQTELVMGGYGKGRGETLYTGGMAYGYAWVGDNSIQRWGANRINNYTYDSPLGSYVSDVIWGNFNDIDTGNYMEYEAAPASHDSGGGWFIKDDGVWKVAGVFRGVEHYDETWFRNESDPNYLDPDYFDAVRVSSYHQQITDRISPYLICGNVWDSDNPVEDVLLLCDDEIIGSDITGSDGYYELSVYYGWSGTITPSKDYYMFSPNSISYSDVTENLTNEDYVVSALISDDFNDDRRSSMWRIFEDDHSLVWVNEINQRLEIRAVGEATGQEAIYASNGWKFDSMQNFSLRVNFHHDITTQQAPQPLSKPATPYNSYNSTSANTTNNIEQLKYNETATEQNSWLFIRIAPDYDNDNYISFEAGCDANGPYWQYEEVVDSNVVSIEQTPRDSNDGRLYISYDANSDELYLSHIEYGSEDAWQIISGLLQYQWAGEPAYVNIGGGSDNIAISSGQLYLDNFEVNSGVLLDWPPATDIDGDGFIDWFDMYVLSKQWLNTGEDLDADINDDNIVNFEDFAEFANAW